jgi:serine phosphatase RsbU (regulator of sigma subunit)
MRTPRLLLVEPGGASRELVLTVTPFRIGRQPGNELALHDSRISRQHARIILQGGRYILEDADSRHGTWVNGKQVSKHRLQPGDCIEFGVPGSYKVVFQGEESVLEELLQRAETPRGLPPSRELHHLGVLLEVARALHAGQILEDVLAAVVDAAVQITRTERGVLLLRREDGELAPAVARDAARRTIPADELRISSSVLRHVAASRRELIVTDSGDEAEIRQQDSIVRMALRTIVAIPLERRSLVESLDSTITYRPSELLGVLYLDSRAPGSAFSELDRDVLHSLAQEAGSVVENARLFSAAREKERLEHELNLAAEIQRGLLPKEFPQGSYFMAAGFNMACESVGGDFFDVFPLCGERYAFVVADVAGKGISSALLASVLQGVFSVSRNTELNGETLLAHINQYLCERSGQALYATLFYSVLGKDGLLEYINAGHVLPLLRTARGDVRPLEAGNLPLGLFPDAEYRASRISLNPGDCLVIFSDGVTEAQNARSELFGPERLTGVLREFRGETAHDLAEAVRSNVATFTSAARQSDDVTLLVVQYRGTAC